MESLRTIRYESQFRQTLFRVASRLTRLTSVLHPQGLIPLTALPRSALTMPCDVTDVEPVSTDVNIHDVNAVCVVLKTGDDVTFGSQKFHLPLSNTCLDFYPLNYSSTQNVHFAFLVHVQSCALLLRTDQSHVDRSLECDLSE